MNDNPVKLIDVEKLQPEAATLQLISTAVHHNASDLVFGTNEQHVIVQMRHLGIVRPLTIMSLEQGKRVTTLIKTRAGLDLAERRRPMDGRWLYQHSDGAIWDLRINMIPTMFGEDYAVRLLARESKLLNLDNIGLTRAQQQHLAMMLEAPGGLMLFTGPTGSGKTATLYACLKRLNNGRRKINTIEDPVEYTLEGVRQSQINPVIELGFSELLRAVMRQAPDVIMIGEIRDQETAAIAIRAANSGHLVLATVHATAAVQAIQSIRALGVHPHFLASSLRGIVAQRLVRTLCPACKVSFDLSDAPHTFDEVQQFLQPGEGRLLWAPRGCDKCFMSGYANRTGVFEVLSVSRPLRHMISDGASVREMRDQTVREKILEFRHSALLKVAHGETSTEEVFRVIPTEHLIVDD